MRALYLDIETLRSPTKPVVDPASIEPPANYKNPDAIARYRNEKAIAQQQREWEESSLDPMLGTLACVGVGLAGEEPEVLGGQGAQSSGDGLVSMQHAWERTTLDRLGAFIDDAWAMSGSITITTWNGEDFDMPFLLKRALHHRDYELVSLIRRLSKPVDLRKTWAMGKWHRQEKGKCRDVARFLGWDGPDDIPGKDVHRYFAMGQYDVVELHCRDDVRALAHIGRVLSDCGFWTERL